ncbi:FAD-dependent oxidoreductase [Pseudoruegeria sp. HB172150]|uniref:FAD-dependent oxidoreductase n=1 Tax=Pseudoruegeria sp. HB172150 TaxID=2721164 RepID=UPI001556468C|nr:FAD-dependent oxidoreductase [Pseudoruegeria sp. HB172150]
MNKDISETCDLVVIGAGIAGLNALFVASQYLDKTAKVVLIDRNSAPGGMWTGIYEHCRLHQPHPSFTVGDIKWDWSKPSDYLATGAEVQAHLAYCLEQIRPRFDLREYFGHTVTSAVEAVGGNARVDCRDGNGRVRSFTAKRVIHAIGYNVPSLRPLELTSRRVISTTPERLRDVRPKAPVYVVGGGKTGMDTVHALVTDNPHRSVMLIDGKGTVFADRDLFFPSGLRRFWGGMLVAKSFRDQALQYDGRNEDQVFDVFRRTQTISLDGTGEGYEFGVLSRQEGRTIAEGLSGVVSDYLEDVVDGPDGPEMILRSGERQPVTEGAVFVACTGYLLRQPHPYRPYLSKGGAILSITQRSMVHFLSSASAYYLTHLFYRDKLRDLPLYEFDGETLHTRNRRIYHTALLTLTYMNQIVMMGALPLKVFTDCGLDIDRHYPIHRRLLALADLKLNGNRYVEHCRKALDTVWLTQAFRCGPLSYDDAEDSRSARRTSGAGAEMLAAE